MTVMYKKEETSQESSVSSSDESSEEESTEEEVNNVVGCFLKWVMDSTDNLCITHLILENLVKIWTFLKTKEEWRILADFSLRCFSLVASEAGVERMFSKHKLVVTHLRRRTSKELRIARLEMKE